MKWSELTGVLMAVAILMIADDSLFCQNLKLVGTGGVPSFINVSDMEISGNYLYLATANTGLLVIDVSNPVNPQQVGHLASPPVNNLGNIFVDGGYLYSISYSSPGIQIIDISNPVSPQITGSFSYPITPNDIWADGHYVYFTSGNFTLTVISVLDPAIPILVSTYSSRDNAVRLTISGNYAYLAENRFLEILDISDPANLILVNIDSSWCFYTDLCIHNTTLYTVRSTTFFDISDPMNLSRLGYSPIEGEFIDICGNNVYLLQPTIAALSSFSVLDATDMAIPLWMAQGFIPSPNYPQAQCVRNDTLFVAGNSYLGIYRLANQGKGFLEGLVLDSLNGLPVEGAIVNLFQNGFIDTTESNGKYFFADIYNLPYTLITSCAGYRPSTDTSTAVIANDTVSYNIVLGRGPWFDVRPERVSSPPKRIKADSTYAVKVTVFNTGIETVSCEVTCEAFIYNSSSALFIDTISIESLPPSTYGHVIMPDSITIFPDTMYKIICYTILPEDENHANDTLIYYCSSETTQFQVWYGNPDGSPVVASVGDLFYVDIYAKTRPDVYVCYMLLNLGVQDIYIDSLLSMQSPDGNPYHRYGKYYSPITEWDDASFLNPAFSPPNPPGWSAESFLGYSDLGGGPNPMLNSPIPKKILTMAMRAVFDTSLFGDTVDAFGPGLAWIGNCISPSDAGDSLGGAGYHVTEYFNRLVFRPGYEYVPGDINNDGQRIAADATYGVRYLKGLGAVPPDSCYMDSTNAWLYMAADVNGNCEFRGSDIVRLVAYFKGTAQLQFCHFFPPR